MGCGRMSVRTEETGAMAGLSNTYVYATKYLRMGLSVIPLLQRDKKPAIAWRVYQGRLPNERKLQEWFRKGDAGVGIVCGRVSGGFTVLDFDSKDSFKKFFPKWTELLNATPVVETSRGLHVWLRSNKPCRSFKIPELQLDVKGEGGFVVAPPSIHPSGRVYRFLNPNVFEEGHILLVEDVKEDVWRRAEQLGVRRVYDLSDLELRLEPPKIEGLPPCMVRIASGVEEGFRNEAGFAYAAFLHSWLKLSPEEVYSAVVDYAEKCRPPLPKAEVKNIVKSVREKRYIITCKNYRLRRFCDPLAQLTCPLKGKLVIVGGEEG